jgi:hypothetical protein
MVEIACDMRKAVIAGESFANVTDFYIGLTLRHGTGLVMKNYERKISGSAYHHHLYFHKSSTVQGVEKSIQIQNKQYRVQCKYSYRGK